MDKKYLMIGGAFLIAGGLAYYLLKNQSQNTVKCWKCMGTSPQYKLFPTGTQCGIGNADNYPYTTQPDCTNGNQPCSLGINFNCHPGYTGFKRCDKWGNLCECNGTEWICLEENAYNCENNIKRLGCFISEENIASCLKTYDTGSDECEEPNKGCYCGGGVSCGDNYFCETYDNKCCRYAENISISANSSNMYCFEENGASYCNYYLDEPVAALSLTGKLYWKWGPIWPGEYVDVAIYGYYHGRWITITDWTPWTCCQDGNWDINNIFDLQAIEMLQFACDALVSNIHIDKFIGHISR